MKRTIKRLSSTLTTVFREYLERIDCSVQKESTIEAFTKAFEFAVTWNDYQTGTIVASPPVLRVDWKLFVKTGDGEQLETHNVRRCLHSVAFIADAESMSAGRTVLMLIPSRHELGSRQCGLATRRAAWRLARDVFTAAWPKNLIHPEIIAERSGEVDADALRAVIDYWNPRLGGPFRVCHPNPRRVFDLQSTTCN